MENNSNNIEIINSKKKVYSTKEIADILKVENQTIRNYCLTYKQFLDENHKPGEHRNFTENDIKKFKIIIYLSKEKHLKPKQIIDYLNKPNETKNMDLMMSLQFLFDDVRKQITTDVKNSLHNEFQPQFDDIKNCVLENNRLLLNRTKPKKKKHWFNIFK